MKKTIKSNLEIISYNKIYHSLDLNDIYNNNHLIYKNFVSFFKDDSKNNICFYCCNLNEPNMIAIIDELVLKNKNIFILCWYKNKIKITQIKNDVLKNKYDFYNFNYRPDEELECKNFKIDYLVICTKFFNTKTNSIYINKLVKKFIINNMKNSKIIGCSFDFETNQININDVKTRINYDFLINQNNIFERKK